MKNTLLDYACKWYLGLKHDALFPKNITQFRNFVNESMLHLLV